MPVPSIEGPTGPTSPVWLTFSSLQERMRDVVDALASRLQTRRDEIISQLRDGSSLSEITKSQGMTRTETLDAIKGVLAWTPGSFGADPQRIQDMAVRIMDARHRPGVAGVSASLAAAALNIPAPSSAPKPVSKGATIDLKL